MNQPIPRFKQIREKMHMSQRDFAKYLTSTYHIKTDKTSIGRYENGIVYPSQRSIEKYSKVLKVTPYYLSGQGPNKEQVPQKIVQTLKSAYLDPQTSIEFELKSSIRLWISLFEQHQLEKAYETGNSVQAKKLLQKFAQKNFKETSFWEEYFHFLLDDIDLIDSLVGTTDEEFINKINHVIQKKYNDDSLSRTLDVLIQESDAIARKTIDLSISIKNKEASKDELIEMIDSEIKRLESLKKSIKNSNDF